MILSSRERKSLSFGVNAGLKNLAWRIEPPSAHTIHAVSMVSLRNVIEGSNLHLLLSNTHLDDTNHCVTYVFHDAALEANHSVIVWWNEENDTLSVVTDPEYASEDWPTSFENMMKSWERNINTNYHRTTRFSWQVLDNRFEKGEVWSFLDDGHQVVILAFGQVSDLVEEYGAAYWSAGHYHSLEQLKEQPLDMSVVVYGGKTTGPLRWRSVDTGSGDDFDNVFEKKEVTATSSIKHLAWSQMTTEFNQKPRDVSPYVYLDQVNKALLGHLIQEQPERRSGRGYGVVAFISLSSTGQVQLWAAWRGNRREAIDAYENLNNSNYIKELTWAATLHYIDLGFVSNPSDDFYMPLYLGNIAQKAR